MTRTLISASIEDDEDVIILRFSDESEQLEVLYHPYENACLQMEDSVTELSPEEYKIIEKELIRFSVENLGYKDLSILLSETKRKAKKIIAEYESKTGIMNHEKQTILFNILVEQLSQDHKDI